MAVINYKAVRRSLKSLRSQVGSAMVGFIQAGTDAVRRSLQDKSRDFVNTRDFLGGLSASKTGAQNSAVLQAAINALGSNDVPTFLYVQDGDFTFSTDITINKVCTLYFGKGTYLLDNCSIVIGGEKSVSLIGQSAKQTTIKGTTAAQNLIEYTGLNSGSDSLGVRTTVIAHLCLHGNSVAASGVVIPTASGSFTMANGRTVIESVEFARFAGTAYVAGESVYFQYFARCQFDYNDIGVDIDRQTDTTFFECLWGPHDTAGLKTAGTQQRYIACSFTIQGGTAPDIWITCDQEFSTVHVGPGCYFGNEGDNSGRYNIVIDSSDGTKPASDISIIDNFFYGDDTQKCIKINTPHDSIRIERNTFRGYATIVDDVLTQSTGMLGGSVFKNNLFGNYSAGATSVFTNGGRGFGLVEYPQRSRGINVPNRDLGPKQQRFIWTDDISATPDSFGFFGSTGVTVTGGQTDSKGGTKAALITLDGTAAAQSFQAKLNVTGLLTDTGAAASGQNGRVVVRVGLKAGTLDYCVIVFRDTTDSRSFAKRYVSLSSEWKEHEFVFTGIDPSHNNNFIIYPGGDLTTESGTMYVEFPSASDFGSEYVESAGSLVAYDAALSRELMFSSSLTPASVAAATSAEQTFTVTGLRTGDVVAVNGPAPTAGTGIVGVRVSASNTLALTFMNATAGSLTPASGTYLLSVSRK